MTVPPIEEARHAPLGVSDPFAPPSGSQSVVLPPPGRLAASAAAAPSREAPAGYVPFEPSGSPVLAATRGLRSVGIWLIGAVATLSVLSAAAEQWRVGTIDDALAGTGSASSVATMDNVVAVLSLVRIAALLGAGLVVMTWTLRIVRNAEAIGKRSIGVRLAAFGWVIPIGHLWLPFARLRSVADVARVNRSMVSWWQAGWVALTLLGVNNPSVESTRDAFARAADRAVIVAVATIACAFVAQRAIRGLDDGIEVSRARTSTSSR